MSGRRRKVFVPKPAALGKALAAELVDLERELTHASVAVPGELHLGRRDDCRTCRRQGGKT